MIRITNSNVFGSSKRVNLKTEYDDRDDKFERKNDERLKTDASGKSFQKVSSRNVFNNTESIFDKKSTRKIASYERGKQSHGFDMKSFFQKPTTGLVTARNQYRNFSFMGNIAFKIRHQVNKESTFNYRESRKKENAEIEDCCYGHMNLTKIKKDRKLLWKFAIVSKALEMSIQPCCHYFDLHAGIGFAEPDKILILQKRMLDIDKALEIILVNLKRSTNTTVLELIERVCNLS